MWYQTADRLSSCTDQNFVGGIPLGPEAFSLRKHNMLHMSCTCSKHTWQSLLIAQVSRCSKVKTGHLELWPHGRRENKTAPNSRQLIDVKRIFSYAQHTKEWWQKTRRVLLSAKALLHMAFLTNAIVLQSFFEQHLKNESESEHVVTCVSPRGLFYIYFINYLSGLQITPYI